MERRTLWDEREQVHKPQATVYEIKSTDIGLCTTQKLGQAS